jgi:hypothetical protein
MFNSIILDMSKTKFCLSLIIHKNKFFLIYFGFNLVSSINSLIKSRFNLIFLFFIDF